MKQIIIENHYDCPYWMAGDEEEPDECWFPKKKEYIECGWVMYDSTNYSHISKDCPLEKIPITDESYDGVEDSFRRIIVRSKEECPYCDSKQRCHYYGGECGFPDKCQLDDYAEDDNQ